MNLFKIPSAQSHSSQSWKACAPALWEICFALKGETVAASDLIQRIAPVFLKTFPQSLCSETKTLQFALKILFQCLKNSQVLALPHPPSTAALFTEKELSKKKGRTRSTLDARKLTLELAFFQLSDEQKLLLLLEWKFEMSLSDLSKIFNVPEGTLRFSSQLALNELERFVWEHDAQTTEPSAEVF